MTSTFSEVNSSENYVIDPSAFMAELAIDFVVIDVDCAEVIALKFSITRIVVQSIKNCSDRQINAL